MKYISILRCILLMVGVNLFTTVKAQPVNKQDSLALVNLYDSLHGVLWFNSTNWLTAAPVSTWYGITLTGTRVTKIDLNFNGLIGTIPYSIGDFDSLYYLDLSYNRYGRHSATGLVGKIPPTIGNLTALSHIDLTYNQISGSIPSSIGNLTKLQDFIARENLITGGLPESIGNCTNLSNIDLYYNRLDGTIPSSVGNLKNLKSLNAAINMLHGNIPSSIGNCINFQVLDLTGNGLTGGIPSSLGNLRNLTYLALSANPLGGSIPSSIGNCTNLTLLGLGGNSLSGSIPSSFSHLTNLTSLNLGGNSLSGSIPSFIRKLIHLEQLYLSSNQFSGSIPSFIGNLTDLQFLYCDHNHLSGKIPSSIGKLTKVAFLFLNVNGLSGELPSSMGDMKGLKELHLDSNHISGSIPISFKKLTHQKLWAIFLAHNELSEAKNVNFPSAEVQFSYITDISYNRCTFDGLEFASQKMYNLLYAPQAPVSIHRNGNILSVYAGGTLNNNTYYWYKTGTTDSTVVTGDSTFQPTENGLYYAHITNSIANQLILTTDTINYTTNALVHNKTDYTGISQLKNKFAIYPNPASDLLHVQLKGAATISITDAVGKLVIKKMVNGSGNIYVAALPAGVYYLKDNSTGETQKFVIGK